MTPIIIDCQQRSAEWAAARLGMLTSTCADDLLKTLRGGGEAAGRRNLKVRLMLEKLTKRSQERTFVSQAMQNGIDREIDAGDAYEALTGLLLQRTGFLVHPELSAGTSLDGHVGDLEGIIEIKSPLAATHLEYLETGKIPLEYERQITHALWISGAEWCDFMSFCPEFPEPLHAKILRVPRSALGIPGYEIMARAFLREVDDMLAKVQAMLTERAA